MFNLEGQFRRIASVAGLALLLLVLFSFSNRIAEFTRLTAQEEIETSRINQLQLTRSYLGDQITYATSEAAVEEWARAEARMAQEGDFPVVPLNLEGTVRATDGEEQIEGDDVSNLQVWLQWFFFRGP